MRRLPEREFIEEMSAIVTGMLTTLRYVEAALLRRADELDREHHEDRARPLRLVDAGPRPPRGREDPRPGGQAGSS